MAVFIARYALLLITSVFGLAYYYDIMDLARKDKIVVELLLLLLVVLIVFRTIATTKNMVKYLAERSEDGEKLESFSKAVKRILRRKEVTFLAVTAPYIALFPIIGFFVTSFIYVLVANIVLGTRGKLKLIAIPTGLTLFAYLLFGSVFNIKLPSGILF